MNYFEFSFLSDKDQLGIETDGRFKMHQCSIAGLNDTPQLILLKSFILLLTSHYLVLQIHLRVLVYSIYLMCRRTESFDCMGLDFEHAQDVVAYALTALFLEAAHFPMVNCVRCVGILL